MKLLTRMTKLRPITMAMVFAVAVMGAQLTQVNPAHAAGGTAIWTGATGDNKFSTAGNWDNNDLPVVGDMLILGEPTDGFTGGTGTDPFNVTVDNDLAIAFGGVQSPTTTNGAFYQFTNNLNLQDGATITLPAANNVTFYFTTSSFGVVGAGDLTISGSAFEFYGPSAINGTLTVQDGATFYPTVAGVTQLILDGGSLSMNETGTYTMPIHVVSPSNVYALVPQGGNDPNTAETMTYSGAVTLDADLTVYTGALKTVHFTGAVTGTGTILADANSTGTLTVDAYATAAEPTVPGPPNTGVANYVKANPVVILAAGVVAAAGLFVATRRRA